MKGGISVSWDLGPLSAHARRLNPPGNLGTRQESSASTTTGTVDWLWIPPWSWWLTEKRSPTDGGEMDGQVSRRGARNERDAKSVARRLITRGHRGGNSSAVISQLRRVETHTRFLSLSLCILIKLALTAKTCDRQLYIYISIYLYIYISCLKWSWGVCCEKQMKAKKISR